MHHTTKAPSERMRFAALRMAYAESALDYKVLVVGYALDRGLSR